MSVERRIRLGLLAAVLLLAVLLALALPRVMRETIAIPIWYVIWVGRLLLYTVPQSLSWAIFLAITLFIAVRSLVEQPEPPEVGEVETSHSGQVQMLLRWIQYSEEGEYFKKRLAQHLGKLAMETLAYRQRLTPRQIRRHLETLDAPSQIRAYLQAGLAPASPRPTGLLARLMHRLRLRGPASPLDLDLEIVVEFLERQLG